jgi:hypothetical protein
MEKNQIFFARLVGVCEHLSDRMVSLLGYVSTLSSINIRVIYAETKPRLVFSHRWSIHTSNRTNTPRMPHAPAVRS